MSVIRCIHNYVSRRNHTQTLGGAAYGSVTHAQLYVYSIRSVIYVAGWILSSITIMSVSMQWVTWVFRSAWRRQFWRVAKLAGVRTARRDQHLGRSWAKPWWAAVASWSGYGFLCLRLWAVGEKCLENVVENGLREIPEPAFR